MTLSNNLEGQLATTDIVDGSTSNWDVLYCSHFWSNSNLRKTILNGNQEIKFCYTCRGKIRKYKLKSSQSIFEPNNHSTPNEKLSMRDTDPPMNVLQDHTVDNNIALEFPFIRNITKELENTNPEVNQCIPSISSQVDSSFRQKYISHEMRPNDINERRLRKSLKGIGCIVNFSLTDSPIKKRTQIQACSISVMIIAIVIISFILVNFTTPSFTRASNVISTIVVPTSSVEFKETFLNITKVNSISLAVTETLATDFTTTTESLLYITEKQTLLSNIISKIQKNIKTYPKVSRKTQEAQKRKDIINRDVSQTFCSCQTNEVCMLDENSGTPICKVAVDIDDPTGCGGLCALETEACQMVDKTLGVRVCRLLTLVTCSPEQWRCRNGLCVSTEARCDGAIQCYDRSDEMHCECDLTKEFRCGHAISCFPNKKYCDGVIDCWDGYDEVNCTTECPEDQFTCTDGQCILPSRFCDGLADCADGSDEPQGCEGACGAHEMRCVNQRCVPRAARCDGHDNCGDATDELHCS